MMRSGFYLVAVKSKSELYEQFDKINKHMDVERMGLNCC